MEPKPRQGTLLLGLLGPVLGSRLLAIRNTLSIQHASDDVIAHTGQIADATAPDKNNGVFLQVVPLTRYVGSHFDAVREANTGHLAEGGVRLLGRHRFDLQAHAALGGIALHRRVLRFAPLHLAWLLDQLIYRRHTARFVCELSG